MKRILIMALFIGLLVPAGLKAQKVYRDASDRLILDLTVAAGMPADAVTNTSKTSVYALFNPSASSTLIPNNDHNGTINADVFQKLEVAPHDMNDAGVIGTTGPFTMNWITAFNGCKNSSYNGGGWRLPTQRELMLIWIFYPAFKSLFVYETMFTADGNYLSSTQGSSDSSSWFIWYINFYDGSAHQVGNTAQGYRARCVRELP
ncbi:DUF1566 domain-containing protein [uncultured Dysgonomonas sp.]|uniref:Lcl C-terminal domain-containing protein n=1 Tax=uncultured Dysgonomonas sp. TaxID=206096 RepID=A0A212JFP5_9BACT|nr:DUF1566 domain-containing protein [uncultured Dysgonomonas sp.]SBV98259.1 exported hypothetical protein [uncultured Dysgonomonas sp.]